MSAREEVFNGLDAGSGHYLLAPMTDAELGRQVIVRGFSSARLAEVLQRFRGTIGDVDPQRLDEAGWGLIMAEGADERFAQAHGGQSRRSALEPLCALRAEEAGALYRDSLSRSNPLFYRQNESATTFLCRYGVRPEDPVNPREMPYYLLLVGGPDEIPYAVQYDLDVQYAVGRICFDRPEEYRAYAAAVVAASEGRTRRRREVALFAVENPGDDATARTAKELVRPLAESLTARRSGWVADARFGAQTDRASLAGLMHATERRPALLLTASHGAGFDCGTEMQKRMQGALVCREWSGRQGEPLPRECYFAAPDVQDDAQVGGLIALLFACYSAGTPQFDSFRLNDLGAPLQIAERDMVSPLVQRLLSHPNGAALAVIGHIDRAWTHSFSGGGGSRIAVFDELVQGLLQGGRLGSAMEQFGRRYGALGAQMSQLWDQVLAGSPAVTAEDFGRRWRAMNDARNFVVFGDPAVRLAVGD